MRFTKSRIRMILALLLLSGLILVYSIPALLVYPSGKPLYLLPILCLAAGSLFLLLFDFKKPRLLICIASALLAVVLPLASLFFIEILQSNVTLSSWINFLMNFALIGGIYLAIAALSGRPRLAAWIGLPLFLIAGIANHYVIAFRGTTLLPWDIAAAKTAMNVLDNFTFTIREDLLLCLVGTVFLLLGAWCFFPARTSRRWIFSGACLAAALGAFAFFGIGLSRFPFTVDNWNQTYAARQNGYLLNFAINLKTLNNAAPEGYSPDAVEQLLKGYESGSAEAQEEKPDVVVIMNEAFADFDLTDLNLSEDPLSFVHSLQGAENAVTGTLISPTFGGGTCNTEYEFLTSNVCYMLRRGSYPMQQFINDESTSVASGLRELGYQTVGIHPFTGSGWNRSRSYPLLGFDEFLTIEDFPAEAARMRNYITDRACYEKITEVLDQATSPVFTFAVTMQNHGGYTESADTVPNTLTFDGQEQYPQTKMYLELCKESDKAVRGLIEALSKRERKTIVLFFGDHQPSLATEYAALFPVVNEGGYDAAEQRFSVPFFLWANFDIEEEHGTTLSSNHLAPLLLEKAGLPLTAYQQYVRDLRETLPVVSSVLCIDSAGNRFSLGDDTAHSAQLTDYRILQYNNVFDKKHLLTEKFTYRS